MIEFKEFMDKLNAITDDQYFDDEDFVNLQTISNQILDARNNDLLTEDQYKGLYYITKSLLDSCRRALYASYDLY